MSYFGYYLIALGAWMLFGVKICRNGLGPRLYMEGVIGGAIALAVLVFGGRAAYLLLK